MLRVWAGEQLSDLFIRRLASQPDAKVELRWNKEARAAADYDMLTRIE